MKSKCLNSLFYKNHPRAKNLPLKPRVIPRVFVNCRPKLHNTKDYLFFKILYETIATLFNRVGLHTCPQQERPRARADPSALCIRRRRHPSLDRRRLFSFRYAWSAGGGIPRQLHVIPRVLDINYPPEFRTRRVHTRRAKRLLYYAESTAIYLNPVVYYSIGKCGEH